MSNARSLPAIALAVLLAGCSATGSSLEPVPGSITYGGQPRTKLTKSPVGSTFEHRFRDQFGDQWVEQYRILPDRSLEIVSRHRVNLLLDLDD